MSAGLKLSREFYLRPTLEVARDLLGKYLIYKTGRRLFEVRLVEVEAYIGRDDPACHAARGKTRRNEIMFGPGGFSYIYFIYGMYHCFNVVTEEAGKAAAVLIRGAEPIAGEGMVRQQYKKDTKNLLTNGPGKLCKALGLTRNQNGLDLTGSCLYLEDRDYYPERIAESERIGIKVGLDKKWRFYEEGSQYVSGKRQRK